VPSEEIVIARPPSRRAPSPRPLTLRDVSDATGVSEMTVSRVLRGRGDVSEATRDRVLQAARLLGYVPNRIAGALASQRVNLVAVVIPSLSNLVFPEVLAGISAGLDGSGLQPVFGATHYDPAREEAVLYEMLSWRPSGVILAGLDHSPVVRAMLGRVGVPVVEVMDTDGVPVDSAVGLSHRAAGAAMARVVLAAGYRRIGYLGTAVPGDRRAAKRREGFVAALCAAGVAVEAEAVYDGGSTLAKGRDLTRAMLAAHPDLDFLYYANDMIGAGGLLWCLGAGYDVPGRLGLAGFNGIDLLDGLPCRLATQDSCRFEIGRRAAEIVAAGLHGVIEVLEPTLTRGDTIRSDR
jgi:LacI family gluconate utilization system Gnt-I transcriptional repressor